MSSRSFKPFAAPADGAPGRASLDRRAFLGGVGVAAGAALAASVLPIAGAQAASLAARPGAAQAHGPSAGPRVDAADAGAEQIWHIDDMWGHWPRYAHPIPHAHAGAVAAERPAAVWERLDPVDRMLVI